MSSLRLILFLAATTTVVTSIFAGWNEVTPSLQLEINRINNVSTVELDNIVVTFTGDSSVAWCAADLADRLTNLGVLADTQQVDNDFHHHPPSLDQKYIHIGLWSDTYGSLMAETFPLIAPLTFGNAPHVEGYYVWVGDTLNFNDILGEGSVRLFRSRIIGLITASDMRGLQYGAVSFGAASDSTGGTISLGTGYFEDYPYFPRRIVGELTDLYGGGQPWGSEEAHANAILVAGRDLLLDHKGNGFMNFGETNSINSADNGNGLLVRETFERLRDGNPAEPRDRWQDFQMDWYQGINRWGSSATRGYDKKTAQIVKHCRFADTTLSGRVLLDVLPLEIPNVPNADFGVFVGGAFEDWFEETEWDQGDPFGDPYAYARATTNGQIVDLGTIWQLQDTVGLPMRQLVLEFDAKVSSGTFDVWLDSSMPQYRNGLDTVTNAEPFKIFDPKHAGRDDQPGVFFDRITNEDWETKYIVFYSFGLKEDSVYFKFKHIGTGTDTVSIDRIRVYDSDFYFVHMLQSPNSTIIRPGYATAIIDSAGVVIDEFSTANGDTLIVTEQSGNRTDSSYWKYHAKMQIPDFGRTLSQIQNDSVWTATVTFHALCTPDLPAFFSHLTPLDSFAYGVGSDEYRPSTMVRDNNSDLALSTHASRISTIIDDLWMAHGPASNIGGLFNRVNEKRFTGWSVDDSTLAASNSWSQADIYGDFCSDVSIGLNTELDRDLPLLLYGDMFNPIHNGGVVGRVNNPFAPINGYTHPMNDIEGADPDAKLVFVDWWMKETDSSEVESLFDTWKNLPNPAVNNWEVMFALLYEENRPNDSLYANRIKVYQDLALIADTTRERGFRFSGGGLMLDKSFSSTNWDDFRERIEILDMFWKMDPVIRDSIPWPYIVNGADSIAEAIHLIFPVPYPDDREAEIDSVVLQYRYNNTLSWQKQKVTYQSDSLYDFSLSLPDTGGYVNYRVWSFDDLGRYGSYPPYGTKWTDADAGERNYFTFERRKDDAIVKPDTFWLPGVITKTHVVEPGGRLVFQPLPGYKHATLYVGDDAEIKVSWTGAGSSKPQVKFNGTDTTYIHVKPLCDTCKWKGISDSMGSVTKNYVTFHEGTNQALILKNAIGSERAQFTEAKFEDSVIVRGPAEITGSATFNKLIIENGATLTVMPGSEFSFFEGGQLIVKKGGKLKAFGNDSTVIVFKAEVDSLPWEGIHCEADSQMAPCSLTYANISGAVAGLLLDRAKGYAEHCIFENNKYGVLANNGAWFEAKECEITENEIGILATNLSSVELLDVAVIENIGPGLKGMSRATFYLEDCVVNENDGDGLAGGIGLYTGSTLFMECTEVDANIGSGITACGGTIMLTSVLTVGDTLWQWQGNRIEHNETVSYEGQITLRNRVALALWNGSNCIWDTTGQGKLIDWDDQIGADRWADVYWGGIDTTIIKTKLPSNVTLLRIDSSRTECPTFVADNTVHDSLVQIFLLPHNAELSAQFTRADSGYKAIVRNSSSSDYALSAVDRILTTNIAQFKAFGPVRDTLETLFGNTSDAALKRWVREGQAWCWAELNDSTECADLLDSLAVNTSTNFDRVAAKAQKQLLGVRMLREKSAEYKATECVAYLDSAQRVLELMNVWTQHEITDSVVMYAPVRVDSVINVRGGGELTVIPHPGSENPTVEFVNLGAIKVYGTDTTVTKGKLYVYGEDENCVQLHWKDSTGTRNIFSERGFVKMKHARFKGNGFVNQTQDAAGSINGLRRATFQADSCSYAWFDEGVMVRATDSTSYMRACTLSYLGGNAGLYSGLGGGLILHRSDKFLVEDCVFDANDGVGIYHIQAYDVVIRNTSIKNGVKAGIYGSTVAGGSARLECCTIESNGDTLPELYTLGVVYDLVGGHNSFADSTGSLILSTDASYVDLEDGENYFEIWDEGRYVYSGDTNDTWDITWNTWSPSAPDDGDFYDYLWPETPAKWTIDSSLADFLTCEEASMSSVGSGNLLIVGGDENAGTMSTGNQSEVASVMFPGQNSTMKSGNVTKATGANANKAAMLRSQTKTDLAAMHHNELSAWRTLRDQPAGTRCKMAMSAVKENRVNEFLPATLGVIAADAQWNDPANTASRFLAEFASNCTDNALRTVAERLSYHALANEGKPADALKGLEGMMIESDSRRDSILALMDAMLIYCDYHHSHGLKPQYTQVAVDDHYDLVRKTLYLSERMHSITSDQSGGTVAVPTSYALYQNYPNPFNPSTEIRFDLPEAIQVELKIFNILGQEVATLVDDVRSAGAYQILWDGKNAGGLSVASGVYVYQIKTPNFTDSKKMVLLR